ncbi:MAG: carboxy terminal-processing peptidase, partial [Wenzhouxiangellaceae bacterium]|nr:carboxy terminal-processing peptidase [Wenzhouxiangellaceae bacterium]
MAKFFRIDGGSTQLRGVAPDITLPSYGEPDDYGEAALDHAMAWSEIERADFQPIADLSPLLPQARDRHLARRETDEELKGLIEDFERFRELDERTSVSLLESERAREREEAEQRRASRFAHAGNAGPAPETDSDDAAESGSDESAGDSGEADGDTEAGEEEEADVLLTESARILVDLIELDQEQHRLVQVQHPADSGSLN